MRKTVLAIVALLLCLSCFDAFAVVTADAPVKINGIHAISVTATGQKPFSAKAPENLGRPSVAVVLSGGGARGLAHIALLEALEERGIPIDMVMGTSMGSLIAGLYCAGYSSGDIERLVVQNDLMDLFTDILETEAQPLIEPFSHSRFNILSLALGDAGVGDKSGIVSDRKILAFFREILANVPSDISFDDLPVPYRAVATDVATGDYVLFEGGSLVDAMRSSMSIPLVFDSYEVQGLYLMDGGLVDNMPVKYARDMGYDIVICMDMNGSSSVDVEEMHSMTGAANATFRLIVLNTIKDQYAYADLVLVPKADDIGTLSFDDTQTIIQRGRDEVERNAQALDGIAAMFKDEDLEVKDPFRIGDYFSDASLFAEHRSEVDADAADAALAETRAAADGSVPLDGEVLEPVKDAFSSSRLNLGVSVASAISTVFDGQSPVILQFLPTIESNFFEKNLKNTGWDMLVSAYLGDNLKLGAAFLLPLDADDDDSGFFFKPDLSMTLGAVTTLANRANPQLKDSMDFASDLKLGIKFTDALRFNSNFGFSLRFYALGRTLDGSPTKFSLMPVLYADGIWYGGFEDSLFSATGLRIDFKASLGFYGNFATYTLGVSYEQNVPLTPSFCLSFDALAVTSREPVELMSSYTRFGGWNGVPGCSNAVNVRDAIMLGAAAQWNLGGFLPSFVVCELRGGWRSRETAFSISSSVSSSGDGSAVVASNMTTAPFSELGRFDIGLGVGYGVKTPMCDFLVGVGICIDGEFSIYFECY